MSEPESRRLLVRHTSAERTTHWMLALAFVLAQPFVDVVLSGAATTAQLGSHLGALEVTLDGPARTALAALAEAPADYWRARASLPWT